MLQIPVDFALLPATAAVPDSTDVLFTGFGNMGSVMKTLSVALFVVLPLGAATLVKDGRSNYSICVSPKATAAETRAADELRRFIGEMSGATLPVVNTCTARGRYLRVNAGEGLGPEEFRIEVSGDAITIEGGRPRGTLYGVYTFLDRLGCRWFTSQVSRIPKMRTIDLPAMKERGKPAFEYREVYVTEALERDWAARNRTNGSNTKLDESTGGKVEYYPFVHSFYDLVPPSKYFKEHPEYFSLIDGARRVERGQLCLTNPEVLKIGVARVREWIAQHPTAQIISVSQNDWEGWCECDRCKRVEQDEGGQHSGPLLRFVNAVADEIVKTNPDKLIDTLAYWYTENPPSKVRPRPNVRIRLCPIGVCESHPYEKCPRSAYFVKNLKAWSAITNQLYIWHYNTNFSHYLAPFPDYDELAADIPLYKRNGVVGLFMEGSYPPGGGGEDAELRSYLMARLLWDPTVNVDRETNEFMQGVYGPAAKPMRAYFDLLQREVQMAPKGLGQHIWIFNLPVFSRAFRPEAERLFQAALAAAGGDPAIRRRVEKAHLPLEYMDVTLAREYRVRDDGYAPDDLTGWQARFAAFAEKLRGFAISSIREGRGLDEDVKAANALRQYSVVKLESDRWRVVAVPELEGRMLQLVDKRTGQNLLRAPQVGDGGYPNTGGQIVQAAADYPLRPWTGDWKVASSDARELVLDGTAGEGVKLRRRIRLDGDWVHTETSAEGGSAELVLQNRADFEPGDIDTARALGSLFLKPGEMPAGSQTVEVPGGLWRLSRTGMRDVLVRFSPEAVARTTQSWTAKGGARVSLAVWSKRGRSVSVATDYGAE